MINDLHIENVALIEKADITFNNGLNVLTGETGAGKSIIIDALNAVLGNRTSKDIVRRGADNALVTAVFSIPNKLSWFEENDIDQTDEIIIQRKISSDGKSSCRVCGIPVTATQLKELTSHLIDIHGQNDGQKLLDEKNHLCYLDSFGDLENDLNNYYIEYKKLVSLFNEIKSITSDNNEKDRQAEILKQQIEELTKANIKPDEYSNLLSKLELLRNSEKIKENLDNSVYLLNNSENSVLALLGEISTNLDKLVFYVPCFDTLLKSLKESIIIIKDIYDTLDKYSCDLDFSEDEYNLAEARKSQLDRLMKKYSINEENLISILDESKTKLDKIQNSDLQLDKLKREYLKQKDICHEAAKILSDKRKNTALNLEKQITNELVELNMPSVKFEVHFENEQKLTRHGIDNVYFLMSANTGEDLGRISKIASGGELSRIMLALKNVFSKNDAIETMIFDEIDTGVSGIAAQRVAEKLYSVSNNKQVMCVTHLPQIASMADSHLLVEKKEIDGRTLTKISNISYENRKYEIARLYGGDNITDTTLMAAGEQLLKAEEYKKKGFK